MRRLIYLLVFMLVSCTPELVNPAEISPVTAIPTETDTTLCAIGQDETQTWNVRLEALTTLANRQSICDLPADVLLYMTYLDYGQALEAENEIEDAIEAYQQALSYFAEGLLAQARLDALQSPEVTETIYTCDTEQDSELADYQASDANFVEVEGTSLVLDNAPYPVYGVTYYPSRTPFERFLTETDLEDVAFEFELIASAGLNTARIFLRPEDLFACDAPIPNVEVFERLDSIIGLAEQNDLRLIMVLTQDVDPSVLYFEDYLLQQLQFIVRRYQDEGAILAWDIRDRGDTDYREGLIRQDIAMRWFADVIIMLRRIDNHHLITLGFEQDTLVTAPLVDFVSFQFFGDYENLRQEIANLRASANRPILLAGTGYSTYSISDVTQRNLLFQTFEEVENNGLAGWVVNYAFDYPRTATCVPPDCPGAGSEINQYGLWNTGYFPKLAVEAIRIATGLDNE
ncbi:MAG: hypothetical protein AAF846_13205 [Chloroflexota bacterium]